MSRTFVVKLGRGARAHIERDVLAPAAIRRVPAAAGGPKGLALMPFDRWLFGEWLRDARDLTLVGASIGAWRMAAAVHDDPATMAQTTSRVSLRGTVRWPSASTLPMTRRHICRTPIFP